MGYFLLVIALIILALVTLGLFASFGIALKKPKLDYDILEYSFPWHEPVYEKEIKEWIKGIPLNYIKIRSPYFYNLNALEIKNNDLDKWIILLHGVALNHKAMLDFAYMYSRMRYNLILWDSRSHGRSEGKNISYGYYEKHDLKAVVDYLREKHGKHVNIGMHGVSMGSGILLSYACGVRDDCDFYIADCSYNNFRQQAYDVVKRMLKMPGFIITAVMFFAQLFVRLIFGYDIKKIDISGSIHRMVNPVLFICCRDDDYINPSMTEDLFNKCGSKAKEIIWFDSGGHGGAFPKNRNGYIAGIKEFISKNRF